MAGAMEEFFLCPDKLANLSFAVDISQVFTNAHEIMAL